jgi:N-acetylmuramoyl-L-alanine amidase
MRKRNVSNIVIHCTAGYGNVESIKKYWREQLKWKSFGYHIIIDLDGNIHQLTSFDNIVNGVAGQNRNSIHISYIGGVLRNDYTKSSDTRTPKQKEALITAILLAKKYAPNARILGHRDFSVDRNRNGRIDANERIKECPSFDAIPEYKHL